MEKTAKAICFLGPVVFVLWTGSAFASTQEVAWQMDRWRLLGGAFALSLATLTTLGLLYGLRRASIFMGITLLLSWMAEAVGLQGGWLFGGAYRYHPVVGPFLPGGVPLFIPLAWFVLAGLPVMLLRSWKIFRTDGTLDVRQLFLKSAWAAWGVMVCDWVLDPIAVSVGLWSWELPGHYFGIPLLNFAGWWGVAFTVFLVGFGWIGMGRSGIRTLSLRYDAVWGLSHGLLLILLGLATHYRLGSTLPVWLALAALSPLSLRWLNEVLWKGRIHRFVGGGLPGEVG